MTGRRPPDSALDGEANARRENSEANFH